MIIVWALEAYGVGDDAVVDLLPIFVDQSFNNIAERVELLRCL
jgi:hypothetical protein